MLIFSIIAQHYHTCIKHHKLSTVGSGLSDDQHLFPINVSDKSDRIVYGLVMGIHNRVSDKWDSRKTSVG